jgi:ribosomal protein L2
MSNLVDKRKFRSPLKLFTVGTKRGSGRNNSGRITSFHRGGGSKTSYRQLDTFQLYAPFYTKEGQWAEYQESGLTSEAAFAACSARFSMEDEYFGRVVRFEYDPNRSGYIALVEWYTTYDELYWYGARSSVVSAWYDQPWSNFYFSEDMVDGVVKRASCVSYTLVVEGMTVGGWLYWKKDGGVKTFDAEKHGKNKENKEDKELSASFASSTSSASVPYFSFASVKQVDVVGSGVAGWDASLGRSFWSRPGMRLPLSSMVVGSRVCNVDNRYLRSGGTSGEILSKTPDPLNPGSFASVVVRFASGVQHRFPGHFLGSVGSVGVDTRKVKVNGLLKAGASRWRGRRPTVRGVAMNPVDHPHGGGEGRTSGGRCSVTPWGKVTKGQPTRKKSKPVLERGYRRRRR